MNTPQGKVSLHKLLNINTYIWNKGNLLKGISKWIFLKHLFGYSTHNPNDIHRNKALPMNAYKSWERPSADSMETETSAL